MMSVKSKQKITTMRNIHKIGKELFITSDEEIKEGDWVFDIFKNACPDIKQLKTEEEVLGVQKTEFKIILTTDQDLIKDGVQAIDDEFLEWFVNNPSCERIEVNGISDVALGGFADVCYKIIIPRKTQQIINEDYAGGLEMGQIIPKEEVISDYDVMSNIVYGENVGERIKIKAKIISKEEPKPFKNMEKLTKIDWEKFKKNPIPNKKETLEEYIEKSYPKDDSSYDFTVRSKVRNGIREGAKWQQQRMYSEEDLKIAFTRGFNARHGMLNVTESREKFIEQFKNK